MQLLRLIPFHIALTSIIHSISDQVPRSSCLEDNRNHVPNSNFKSISIVLPDVIEKTQD